MNNFGPLGAIRSGSIPSVSIKKEIIIAGTDFNSNSDNFRVRPIGSAGSHRFTFYVPFDFNLLDSAALIGIPNGTNASAPIDLDTQYGSLGELFDTHTQSVIGGTFPIVLNRILEIPLNSVLTFISAGDRIGMVVDHMGIGTTINYIGIRFRYV